jgi:hypothetical protein
LIKNAGGEYPPLRARRCSNLAWSDLTKVTTQ